VGVTQSHGLADAEDMARSYIAMMRDVAPDSFTIDIVPEVGGGLDKAATDAREAVRHAEEAQRSAAAQSRSVARQLQERGLSGRDIAALLQLSPQRVSQLLQPKPKGGKVAAAAMKSPRATSVRGKSTSVVLKDARSAKTSKSVAGSALTQTARKKTRKNADSVT
jgi:predicted transcriptional regulator